MTERLNLNLESSVMDVAHALSRIPEWTSFSMLLLQHAEELEREGFFTATDMALRSDRLAMTLSVDSGIVHKLRAILPQGEVITERSHRVKKALGALAETETLLDEVCDSISAHLLLSGFNEESIKGLSFTSTRLDSPFGVQPAIIISVLDMEILQNAEAVRALSGFSRMLSSAAYKSGNTFHSGFDIEPWDGRNPFVFPSGNTKKFNIVVSGSNARIIIENINKVLDPGIERIDPAKYQEARTR